MTSEVTSGHGGDSHSSGHDGHDGHASHQQHRQHHITPVSVYLKTFAALLILMLITIYASFINLGAANNFISMGIAITKALLVILFFMQVKYGTKLTWLWASLGFIWFLLMFGISSDYVTRKWIPVPGWQPAHSEQK